MLSKHTGALYLLLYSICTITGIHARTPATTHTSPQKCVPESFLKTGLRDAGNFTLTIISWNTLKVIAAFTPVYIGSRYLDNHIQHHFYCKKHHHNKHQLHNGLYHFANVGVPVIAIPLALVCLFPVNQALKTTTTVFAFSLPIAYAIKKIAKLGKYHGGCRPPNALFSKKKKWYGGCPSGHMAIALYMTCFFGLRHGPNFAVPLGIFTGIMAVDFIICNRHYLSQLVAGAALGTIYTVSAYTLTKKIDAHRAECALMVDHDGHPGVQVTYRF